MKQLIGQLIVSIAIVIASVLITRAMNIYNTNQERFINNQARYHCALSSRYETQDESGATVSYTVPDLYKECLAEKGL